MLHENIDSLRVSSHHSPRNWGHAEDIAVIHVGAMRNQDTSEIRVTLRNLCGMTQSRPSADIRNIRWTAILKQKLEGC
jgi:hypothetical protein